MTHIGGPPVLIEARPHVTDPRLGETSRGAFEAEIELDESDTDLIRQIVREELAKMMRRLGIVHAAGGGSE